MVVSPSSSPVAAIGAALIDIAPPWAKDTAIALFGTADKIALIVGIALAMLVLAALAGWLQARRPPWGVALIAVFGITGAIVAATRPGAGSLAWLPALVAGAVGAVALWLLVRLLQPTPAVAAPAEPAPGVPAPGVPAPARPCAGRPRLGRPCTGRTRSARRRFRRRRARRPVAQPPRVLRVGGRRRGGRHPRDGGRRARRDVRDGRGRPAGGEAPAAGSRGLRRPRRGRARHPGSGRRRHAERPVLPHRHRPHRARGRSRRLAPARARHGGERVRADVGRAAGAAARGVMDHARLRVERGRRHADRQRPLARLSDPRAARPGAAHRGCRHGAVAVDRRVHGIHPPRVPHRRAQRDPRRRHERRPAADAARLPGAHGRAGPLRLRVGDEVGRRSRGDALRSRHRVLDDPRMVGAGTRSSCSRASTSRARARG